jgi:hypothetical protein
VRNPYGASDVHPVFPDWSPYRDLESAARAYLRDPDLAIEALSGVVDLSGIEGFTLERFVNEWNGVWQEVVVVDGGRLVLWHGEDMPPGDGPAGSLTSSLRIVPLRVVSEVGCRRRVIRTGEGAMRVESVDVYVLLSSLDEAGVPYGGDESAGAAVRHDALRFGKTLDDGVGQIGRLEEFGQLVAGKVGLPFRG